MDKKEHFKLGRNVGRSLYEWCISGSLDRSDTLDVIGEEEEYVISKYNTGINRDGYPVLFFESNHMGLFCSGYRLQFSIVKYLEYKPTKSLQKEFAWYVGERDKC